MGEGFGGFGGRGELPVKLVGRDQRQVLVGEIESGFEVAEQVQQGVAEPVQRLGQPAGQLSQGDVEFVGIGGVDHAEHRFGLREVDPAGEERSERELARLGQSRPGRAALPHDGLQQRRGADRVQFGDRPARVAAAGRPEVQFRRQEAVDAVEPDRAADGSRPGDRGQATPIRGLLRLKHVVRRSGARRAR